jgi:hypothetical protein
MSNNTIGSYVKVKVNQVDWGTITIGNVTRKRKVPKELILLHVAEDRFKYVSIVPIPRGIPEPTLTPEKLAQYYGIEVPNWEYEKEVGSFGSIQLIIKNIPSEHIELY